MLHVGVVQRAAHGAHRRRQRLGLGGHDLGALVRHQPGDRHLDDGQFLALREDHHPAADLAQPVGGSRHVGLVGADDDHVVRIMRHRRRQRAILQIAEAGDEAVDHRTRATMPLDQRDLADVVCAIHAHQAVLDGKIRFERARRRLVLDHADDPGAHLVGAGRCGDVEILRRQHLAELHRLLGARRIIARRDVDLEPPGCGQPHAARPDLVDDERRQIRDDEEVGQPPRRDRAQFALQPEMLGRVERRHLDRRHRLQPLRNGVAHDAVHVAVLDQGAGMAVVGAQDEVARIEPAFRHRLDLGGDVVPGRAEPQHRLHALPHAGDGILDAGALVVVLRATGDIAVEGQPEVGRGIVPADRLAGGDGGVDLAAHLGVVGRNAWKIHHFAEPDDVVPAHRFGHFGRADQGARIFEPRRRGHAGRHLDVNADRHVDGLVMHQPHALQP